MPRALQNAALARGNMLAPADPAELDHVHLVIVDGELLVLGDEAAGFDHEPAGIDAAIRPAGMIDEIDAAGPAAGDRHDGIEPVATELEMDRHAAVQAAPVDLSVRT